MEKKIEIAICLGSSCFSRGNKEVLKIIETFIENHNLKERVYFHGAHCFGNCNQGPMLKIDDKLFEMVDSSNIHMILNEAFFEII